VIFINVRNTEIRKFYSHQGLDIPSFKECNDKEIVLLKDRITPLVKKEQIELPVYDRRDACTPPGKRGRVKKLSSKVKNDVQKSSKASGQRFKIF